MLFVLLEHVLQRLLRHVVCLHLLQHSRLAHRIGVQLGQGEGEDLGILRPHVHHFELVHVAEAVDGFLLLLDFLHPATRTLTTFSSG